MLSGLANSADAATVTIGFKSFYNGSNDAPIYSTVAPDAFIPLFTPSISGSSSGVTRSPYETNTIGAGTAYSVLSPGGQPSPGSSATYNLYGATNFTILWGSPDTYNHVTFYSGLLGSGSVLSTTGISGTDYIGSDTGCYTTTCKQFGWDLASFSSSLPIGSVVLSNDGTAAFEYGLANQLRHCPPPCGFLAPSLPPRPVRHACVAERKRLDPRGSASTFRKDRRARRSFRNQQF